MPETITRSEYLYLHNKLRSTFGKAKCCENPDCNSLSKKYHWALKKGHSYSSDKKDYFQFCVSCHRLYDITEVTRLNMSNAARGKIKGEKINVFVRSGIEASKKPINQFSKSGNFIKTFSSLTEVTIQHNILQSSLSNCLNGKSKSAGGYKWLYNLNQKQNEQDRK